MALAMLAVLSAGVPAGGAAQLEPPLVRLFEGGRAGDELVLADPRTLRPTSRRVRTFRDGFGGAFAPDGSVFAYGSGFGRRSIVQLIAVDGWRTLARLDLGADGPVAVSWAAQERLIAVTGEAFGTQRLVLVAVPSGEVLARHRFRGRRLTEARSPHGLVILLAPARGLGPARLLLADAGGGLRAVELERIRAGGNEDSRRTARFRVPGVTVDPDAGVAYVVAAGPALVAEVDLASAAVTYHRLRTVGDTPATDRGQGRRRRLVARRRLARRRSTRGQRSLRAAVPAAPTPRRPAAPLRRATRRYA